MNLRIFDTLDDLIAAAARTIEQRAVDGSSVALSGGNTPKPLYELLGSPSYRDRLAERKITWVIVDERHVPITDPQSNAGMVQQTLFRQGMPPRHDFLYFNTNLTPAQSAAEFELEWRRGGLSNLDVVILGIGDDGHTASLFPGTPVLQVENRIVAEVFVPRLNQWRETLTLPTIRAAKLRIVLCAGESKRKILSEIKDGADYPVVRATAGEIESWWFVDRAAVGFPA